MESVLRQMAVPLAKAKKVNSISLRKLLIHQRMRIRIQNHGQPRSSKAFEREKEIARHLSLHLPR